MISYKNVKKRKERERESKYVTRREKKVTRSTNEVGNLVTTSCSSN